VIAIQKLESGRESVYLRQKLKRILSSSNLKYLTTKIFSSLMLMG